MSDDSVCITCGGKIVPTTLSVSVNHPSPRAGGGDQSLRGKAKVYHCEDCKQLYSEPPPPKSD